MHELLITPVVRVVTRLVFVKFLNITDSAFDSIEESRRAERAESLSKVSRVQVKGFGWMRDDGHDSSLLYFRKPDVQQECCRRRAVAGTYRGIVLEVLFVDV